MKIYNTIFLLTLFGTYSCFFLFSFESFRDSVSFRKKHTKLICGHIISEFYTEDFISEYLAEHKMIGNEKWDKFAGGIGGLVKERLYEEAVSEKYESYIVTLNEWLKLNKHIDKKSDSEIDTFILPIIVKFLECNRKGDDNCLGKISSDLHNDIYKVDSTK